MKIRNDWRAKLSALVEGKELAPISRLAKLNPTFIRDTLEKGTTPQLGNAVKLSEALGVPVENWFLEEGPAPKAQPRSLGTGGPFPAGPERLPVYGLAACGPDGWSLWNGDVIDTIPRPANLAGAPNAYAVYVVGESMEPRYHSGELAHIHPGRPYDVGSYVLVQLKPEPGDSVPKAVLKRLARKSATKVTLEQFNPPKKFDVALTDIVSIHRVVGSSEA